MQALQPLWKFEKYIFGAIVFLFLIPVIGIKYFPTIDGPAHLYNGNLLNQLWFHGKTEILQFFDVNRNLEPNWITHIWYALIGSFFQSFIVEKSVLVFYIIALPYSFRFLIDQIVESKTDTRLSSYLIFPFIYSFPFCMGFFNFCIGIPILFFSIAFWIYNREKYNFSKAFQLLGLTTLLYFTHLFNFLFFGMIIFIFEIIQLWKTKQFKNSVRYFQLLFLSCLPGIIFSALFIFTNKGYEPPKYISKERLLAGLFDLSPIITLSHEKEKTFAVIIFFSLSLLVALAGYNNFINRNKNNEHHSLSWIILSIIFIVLYFTMPDWMVSGGFISIRLALFFFLMIIIWIAASGIPEKLFIAPLTIIMITSFCFLKYHFDETKKLSMKAEEILLAESRIEKGKTLLPLNYSDNWLHCNLSNYIGAHKFIIVLDNYEATKPHFPFRWKEGQNPYMLIGNFGSKNPCISIEKYELATGHRIDYISRWYYNKEINDSCTKQTTKEIESKFDLLYTSPHHKLELFKRKS